MRIATKLSAMEETKPIADACKDLWAMEENVEVRKKVQKKCFY